MPIQRQAKETALRTDKFSFLPEWYKPKSMHWQTVVVVGLSLWFFTIFARYGFTSFAVYAVPGFDTGIFAQGTYLLSRFEEPFVTLRGLHIFGDHSSFILLFLAPLYWLWADPRVLLLAQAATVTIPALVAYALAVKPLGRNVALGVAVLYVSMPAAQYIPIFHFHPEGLATGFLALALWAYFHRKGRLLAGFLLLALLCKEDVSFVVFGFGLVMVLEGKRRWGAATALCAMGYFILVTFVAMPLINGRTNLYFQRNYGLEVDGLLGLAGALPTVLLNGVTNLAAEEGLLYLALFLGPVLFLPLLRARWLIPVLPPLILNFASLIPYQHQISFQYLATSVPFVIIATVEGLKILKRSSRLGPTVAAAVAVAITLSWVHGPKDQMLAIADNGSGDYSAQQRILALVPRDAAVSATFNLNAHLLNRRYIYEFPNPYHTGNWAFGTDEPHPIEDIERVEYVVVDEGVLGGESLKVYEKLKSAPNWRILAREGQLVLLSKTGPTPAFSGLPEPQIELEDDSKLEAEPDPTQAPS